MSGARTLDLPGSPDPVDQRHGSLQFIGTATVLLRFGGFTILTDPNFLHRGDHVHLGYGLRSRRRTNPAIEFDQLPPIDFVILSHLHEDHFDREVERRLDRSLPIVSTPQAASALQDKGFRAAEALATWEPLTVRKGEATLRITAMPGRHGPGIVSKPLPSVMGSMLEFGSSNAPSLRLYISGDTLIHDQLREIPRRFPEIDLALLHLGGTRIAGILLTMDAQQGVEAIRIIAPRRVIPIHYNDYTVFKSSLKSFARAVRAAGMESTVHYLRHGETYTFEAAAARGVA